MSTNKPTPAPAANTFAARLKRGAVYVDKTDLIAELAGSKALIFLIRPPHFGKTTLLDTIEELFANGLKSFQGLKIAEPGMWTDTTYPVLRLDFAKVNIEDPKTVSAQIYKELNRLLFKNQLASDPDAAELKLQHDLFTDALDDLPMQSLVLLIDNYDAPLNTARCSGMDISILKGELRVLFNSIKRWNDKFRFILVTGITEYTKLDLSYGFNMYRDISFDSDYAALTGFTEEEIQTYFAAQLKQAVQALNQACAKNEYTAKLVLEKLKENYGGYCFDNCACQNVYNPSSVLNFFKAPEKGFKRYWLTENADTHAGLTNYLKQQAQILTQESRLDVAALPEKLKRESFEIFKLLLGFRFTDDEVLQYKSLLLQTGYLSIQTEAMPGMPGSSFHLCIPNNEARSAFKEIVAACAAH